MAHQCKLSINTHIKQPTDIVMESIYNNMYRPSNLEVRTGFYCFKDKIVPKWEDPVCAKGGNWSMSFLKGKSDASWLYTLLAMIGEQFDHGDEICGAIVNARAKDKISIWTKNAANETAQVSIGKQWKKFLDYNDNIGFIFHNDALKLDKGAKNRYTVEAQHANLLFMNSQCRLS
ncbi:Eukaryotic translation initiation factor 4E-1 like [Actinidia chinensis var. chinensis]|uniref:eIF-4F 25 kDa subunit n=1 Tax=Actinidia chinensis var. chinensis TaxID=1590841 RepID=A0A2R6QQ51_ACTCC|nr:Eukaryotic translation initiation factor 4E-1 like [Actinidia chinensis var. chinensis]